jgi:sterol 24-C-methyltransferase
MAPVKLEQEDKQRDAEFAKAMHGTSAADRGGLKAMLNKNTDAQKAAVDAYFKYWDNKGAGQETEADKKVGDLKTPC